MVTFRNSLHLADNKEQSLGKWDHAVSEHLFGVFVFKLSKFCIKLLFFLSSKTEIKAVSYTGSCVSVIDFADGELCLKFLEWEECWLMICGGHSVNGTEFLQNSLHGQLFFFQNKHWVGGVITSHIDLMHCGILINSLTRVEFSVVYLFINGLFVCFPAINTSSV